MVIVEAGVSPIFDDELFLFFWLELVVAIVGSDGGAADCMVPVSEVRA
jgi:hypothetical protein